MMEMFALGMVAFVLCMILRAAFARDTSPWFRLLLFGLVLFVLFRVVLVFTEDEEYSNVQSAVRSQLDAEPSLKGYKPGMILAVVNDECTGSLTLRYLFSDDGYKFRSVPDDERVDSSDKLRDIICRR